MKFICLLLPILLFTPLKAEEGSDNPRILIAMEQTAFKKKLVEKMKIILKKHTTQITIVKDSEKEIGQFKAADRDAKVYP